MSCYFRFRGLIRFESGLNFLARKLRGGGILSIAYHYLLVALLMIEKLIVGFGCYQPDLSIEKLPNFSPSDFIK